MNHGTTRVGPAFPCRRIYTGKCSADRVEQRASLRSEKLTMNFFLIFLRITHAGGMQYGGIMPVIIRMHLGGGYLCDFPNNFWCLKLSHKQSGELSRYFALSTVAS